MSNEHMFPLTFDGLAASVSPGDSLVFVNTNTPGLDAREGVVIKCIGAPIAVMDEEDGIDDVIVPVVYPRSTPYYSNRVGGIRESESNNLRFAILGVDEAEELV